jgi:hypothetical protein
MSIPGSSSPLFFQTAAADAAGGGPIKSVRFNDDDSAYLSRTPSSAGNRKTWTFSTWCKQATPEQAGILLNAQNGTTQGFASNFWILFYAGTIVVGDGGYDYLNTNKLRDASSWYHIVVACDTTQSSASDRLKIYINGVESTYTGDYRSGISQNSDTTINSTYLHRIGNSGSYAAYFDGYLADTYLIDGSALSPTSFGAFDDNGVWQAAAYSGSFGTNGFHLFDFANESGIGNDSSGNDNDFTVYNISDGAGPSWFFDGSAGTKITGTMTALGSGDFTVEMFIEKTTTETQEALFSFGGLSGTFETDSAAKVRYQAGSVYGSTIGTNTRTHIAWVRDSSKGYIYVNGTLVSPSSGISDTTNYTATAFSIGSRPDNGEPFEGYIDNLRVVVGTAVYTSNFSVPSTPLTAVTNTKLLTLTSPTLEDTSGQSVSLTNSGVADQAGSGNDILFDVPTNGDQSDTGAGGEVSGNYATFNPLDSDNGTLSNGNLTTTKVNNSDRFGPQNTTIGVSSGKWYAEFKWDSGVYGLVGITHAQSAGKRSSTWHRDADTYTWYFSGAFMSVAWPGTSTFPDGSNPTFTVGDVVGVLLDKDNDKLYFTKNGSYIASMNAATGANGIDISAHSGKTAFMTCGNNNNTQSTFTLNAGQRAFTNSAPSGYKALCTANLPTPTIADGSAHFESKLYTGNGSTNALSMSNSSMSPDWVYIHARSTTGDHEMFDIIRGANEVLESNSTNQSSNVSNTLTSFDSNGFTLGSSSLVNDNNVTYVAYAWDGGSSNATNTSGSVNSTVRANASAGFSIVKWTGTGSAETVGHGLGAKPHLIISHRISGSGQWPTYNAEIGATKYMYFNSTIEAKTYQHFWNNTEPTSSVFSIGTDADVSINNGTHIAYCFAPVEGYQAMGHYDGIGSSPGAFVYTGFRPALVMIKRITVGESWVFYDSSRDDDNPTVTRAWADLNYGDSTNTSHFIDILSNGFKVRSGGGLLGASGSEYFYWAIAENPFQANGGLAR